MDLSKEELQLIIDVLGPASQGDTVALTERERRLAKKIAKSVNQDK